MAFIELDIPADQHDRIRQAFALIHALEPDDERIDELIHDRLLRQIRSWVLDAEASQQVQDLRRQIADDVREKIVVPNGGR